jgi:hypothetical protein
MARVTVLTISGTYDLTSGTLLISLQGEVVVVDSELPDDEQGSAQHLPPAGDLNLSATTFQTKPSSTYVRCVRGLCGATARSS